MLAVCWWKNRPNDQLGNFENQDINAIYGTYYAGVEYNTVKDTNTYYGKDDPTNETSGVSHVNPDYATSTETSDTNKSSVTSGTSSTKAALTRENTYATLMLE